MNEQEKQEITQDLLALFDARYIIDKLNLATGKEAEELANSMARAMWDMQRGFSLPDAKRYITTRYLDDGSEVTTNASGTVLGLTGGKSQFDIVNFLGANMSIDSASNARQVNIRTGGGGADCMFDWIVSECWATEVAAGRGYEGQAMKSLTGCTFYVTSLIQNAWDGVGDGTGAKNFNEECTVYVCPGGGIGQLAIAGDNANSSVGVTFVGTNRNDSAIPGTGAAYALDISGGTKPLYFHDLGFADGAAQRVFRHTAGTTNLFFSRCRLGLSNTYTGFTDSAAVGGVTVFQDTTFPVNQAGEYAADNNTSAYYTRYINCQFADRVRCGKETWFEGCIHEQGAAGKGIVLGAYTGSSELHVEGSKFRTSASPWTYYIEIDRLLVAFDIQGCTANTGATAAVYIGSAFGSNGAIQSIVGNSWDCALGLDQTSTTEMIINYSANSHTGGGLAGTTNPIIAQGKFQNSTFDGNGPGRGYVSFAAGSVMNRVNGVMVNSGAPSHTAAEGQEYFDSTANTMYVNTDGATTWAVLGVAGGGGAAPADATFVTLSTNGTLTNERVLTAANGVDVIDGGAGSTVTLRVNTVMDDDGDTKIQTEESADEDIIRFDTGGTQRMVITSDGRVVVGGDETQETLTIGGSTQDAKLAVRIDGVTETLGLLFTQHSNTAPSTVGPTFATAKSRGSLASQSGLSQNDILYNLAVYGHDGTDYALGAYIRMFVDATPGAGDMPTRIVFATSADGAESPSERLRLTSDGAVQLTNLASAPATPGSSKANLYVLTADELLRFMGDNAAAYLLAHTHLVNAYFDWSAASTTTPQVLAGPMPHAGVITDVKCKAGENVTIGATAWIGDVHLIPAANINTDGQGTSIFTVKPTVTNGNMAQSYGAPDLTTAFAAGDYLAFYTDQAGTSATYGTVSLTVRYT